MTVQLNVSDLREYGLSLIRPSDPSFSESTETSYQKTMKPFSVLLKNTSDKTVIAYNLKWELMRPDGKFSTITQGFTGLEKLGKISDAGSPKPADVAPEVSPGGVIKPGSVVFCSPAGTLSADQYAAGITVSTPQKSESQNEAREGPQKFTAETHLSSLTSQLSGLSSITVSLDAVLFDDGTFVGPDSTNFFSWVTGKLNSKADLLQEVYSLEREKSVDEAVEHLQATANKPKLSVNHKSTPDEIYEFYKRRFAQQMVRVYEAGGFKAIKREMAVLTNPSVRLRRR